ncbi:neuritin 1-like a isoform X1 [Takifugu rubripes]|uniref:Neuritin 1-like a n=1 Tax=Takifugu rubripes TaxID=31033 RepID=A0A3B5K8Z7_TAKRU|nr:neuritin-like isoform X1 [Takifugu rubripes]
MSPAVLSVWRFLLPVALLLLLGRDSVAAARRCHSIYKGFAQCLMALGDSLTDNARRDEDTNEIHSICRSWDQFHSCANVAMAGCPQEAAVVWESLRQESRKMQFSGNLYDMCSNRQELPAGSPSAGVTPSQNRINQESLRGHAPPLDGLQFLLIKFPLLLLVWMIVNVEDERD